MARPPQQLSESLQLAVMRNACLGFLLLFFTAGTSSAQKITVQLLDGRNGQPMNNQVVDVWFGDHASGVPLQVRTGQNGATIVSVPHEVQTFVAAGEWVSDCRGGNTPGKSYIDSSVYPITAVLSTGIVAENRCGKGTQQTVPGTFTLFVRPLHWWEKLGE
jgi:hypothetical protein